MTTGRDLLRDALRGRKLGLAAFASEIHTSTHALESFLAGKDLPADILDALVTEIFGGAVEFNHETGMPRSANKEPPVVFATALPPQWDPTKHPPVPRERSGAGQPSNPLPPRKPQPGWE
jgi:hypothetical protein